MKHSFLKKAAAFIMSLSILAPAASAQTVKTDRSVRDPCILNDNGAYYMYGTGLAWPGYGCSVSTDLKNWSEPFPVFIPGDDFDGDGDYWAPECHFYKGAYYLFATYHSAKTGHRGVAVFRSDSPAGPFTMISDGHVTPAEHDSIDGTLYVDKDGVPWMIYVSEWTSNSDGKGDMAAVKLKDDLTAADGQPVLLFRADAPIWNDSGVTDGPWLYTTSSGRLIMLWSSFKDGNYCVGIAYSLDGRPDGIWRQQPVTLYSKRGSFTNDGGHGMLFKTADGRLMLSIHSPNSSSEGNPTTAMFLETEDIGDTLVLKDSTGALTKLFLKAYYLAADIFKPLIRFFSTQFSSAC